MKKVIVFGGSGFIGSHVADSLSEKNYEVTIFDSSPSKWLGENQRQIIGNILDKRAVYEAIKDHNIVYNFAAVADLNIAVHDPLKTAEVNIIGNLNILQSCVDLNIQRFIYASSIYVYSREGGFYRCSKQAAESFIKEFHNKYKLDYTILRYGSLYGPRASSDNGLYRIIKEAILDNTLSYQGSKESVREYIHVSDAADTSVEILSNEYSCQSLILTGSESKKVSDVLKILQEIFNFPNSSVKFSNNSYEGHYTATPYSFEVDVARKLSPRLHHDLGQGLLEMAKEIYKEVSCGESRNQK